ncbi:MAG: hypothetical protein KBD06_03490, partial [Candidatus Pacebacteria bacterium]|nr:hypothetical protein [Candidatus Paceibacterota bacterium]
MKSVITRAGLFLTAIALPSSVLAQGRGLEGTMGTVMQLLNGAIGLLVLLAIVAFFWGVIRYMFGDGATAKSDGLKFMMYGIITIFVMVSIWGIIKLLQDTVD